MEADPSLLSLNVALGVLLVDILLSGDNAIVIALVCRRLSKEHRTKALWMGVLGAFVARLVLTSCATLAMHLPLVKLIGGLLLLKISIELIVDNAGQDSSGAKSDHSGANDIYSAARTIILADIVMSLDNVLALSAITQNNWQMLAAGLLLSIPILMFGSLYLSLFVMFAFVFVPILLACGVRVRDFLKAIREPALTAFSTASSEAALPRLLDEMVRFGVPRRVAGFVIPTGYSFNLDGSTLYLVFASLAIAQAAHLHLSVTQQITMVLTFMLSSKGVAGVPRATLVIIAGTCASYGLPGEAGVAMLLAVDEVMDMARTTLNVTGNALASVVIARWEGVFRSEPADEAQPEARAA